jgi:hypothetical protein
LTEVKESFLECLPNRTETIRKEDKKRLLLQGGGKGKEGAVDYSTICIFSDSADDRLFLKWRIQSIDEKSSAIGR